MKFDLSGRGWVAVHCKTEEEAEKLLEYLYNNEYTWPDGESLMDTTSWDVHKKNTCYCIDRRVRKVYFDTIRIVANDGLDIIEFEDLDLKGGEQ